MKMGGELQTLILRYPCKRLWRIHQLSLKLIEEGSRFWKDLELWCEEHKLIIRAIFFFEKEASVWNWIVKKAWGIKKKVAKSFRKEDIEAVLHKRLVDLSEISLGKGKVSTDQRKFSKVARER